ncbi:MAG: DUF4097 domain-containing protein [bacterium]|nr:DUF4097 domain-containing protein [bacterium]
MHRLAAPSLTLLVLATSCSFPQHLAKGVVEDSVPAAGLNRLKCHTHNGSIRIEARPGAPTVSYRVEMAVRGHTPEEARDNLSAMRVAPRTDGDELTLRGEYDAHVRGMSPQFSFVVEAPPELAARLVTHNGSIQVVDRVGPVNAETHNGRIRCSTSNRDFRLETHNGSIELDVAADGPLDGKVITHNGSVRLSIPTAADASVAARTHNGHITVDRPASAISRSRGRFDCKLGDGSGLVVVRTHNGNVVIR